MFKDPLVAALREHSWTFPRLSRRVLRIVFCLVLILAVVDCIVLELNQRRLVLPQFDMDLLPYHDARVTRRNALLQAYQKPPSIIFTGDSRVKNGIIPEVVARTLGVPHETFFNFGTGSQVVRFAREVFLPHLLDVDVHPRYLVFGVSPDWALEKRRLWKLIDLYRESLAYQFEHAPVSNRDQVERFITRFLSYRLSIFRYRQDLIQSELIPDLRCWFLGDCYRHAEKTKIKPAHFKDLERRSGFKTDCGWGPQPFDGHTTGEFLGGARFSNEISLDRENLLGLFRECRQESVIPILLIMPIHPSFRQVHDPVMSQNQSQLEELAVQEGVDIIRANRDYSDLTLFVDGHHLSHQGAVYFSVDIAQALSPYLADLRGIRSRRGGSTEDLLRWIYLLNPEIEVLWGRGVEEVLEESSLGKSS